MIDSLNAAVKQHYYCWPFPQMTGGIVAVININTDLHCGMYPPGNTALHNYVILELLRPINDAYSD